MNLRSLQARLRKLEKAHGVGDLKEILSCMSDEELDAGVTAYDLLCSEAEDAHDQAVQSVMEIMDVGEKHAESFIAYWQALMETPSEPLKMSDEELITELGRLDASIETNWEALRLMSH